jgi:hypothetical protein
MKLLKYLGLLYSVAAALVLTAFGVHAAIEEFTGKIIVPKAHDVYAVLRAGEPEAEAQTEGEAEKSDQPVEVIDSGSQLSGDIKDVAIDLRQEIKQIAEGNQRWDAEVKSILQTDLQKNLEEISRQTKIARELRNNRDTVLEGMLPLLNGLMDGKEAWTRIEGTEALKAILGNSDGTDASGDSSGSAWTVERILKSLRFGNENYGDRSRRLHGLGADVLAGILSSGLDVGGEEAGGVKLTEEDAVRFLLTLEDDKLTKVFTALREENPERASGLMARMLRGKESKES